MDSRDIALAKIDSFKATASRVKATIKDAKAGHDKVVAPAKIIITNVRECNNEKGKKNADWFQTKINTIASQYQELSVLKKETQVKASHIQLLVNNMFTSFQEIKSEVSKLRSKPTEPGSLERDIADLLEKSCTQLSGICNEVAPSPQVFQALENARLELFTMCDTDAPKLFRELQSLYPSLVIPSLTATIKKMPAPSAPPQELVEHKEQQFSKPASSQPSYIQYNARPEGQPEGFSQTAGSTSQYEQKEQQSAASPVIYTGAGVQTTAGILGRLPAQAPQQGAGMFAHHPAPSAPVQVQAQSAAALPIQRISLSAQFREYQALKKNTSISTMPQQIRRVVA